MKEEPRPTKHQLDHVLPTVIHHPEEDLPVLARWLHHAMENQTRFWSLLVGLVVVVIGLTVLVSGLSMGRASSDEAWTELDAAKTAAERVKIAERFPNTPAERWALLQAATEYYNKGFADLPQNKQAAVDDLKKALDLFTKVAKGADKNSDQGRAAAFGIARTYEAQNALPKAIDQYESVAKAWPDSDEGRQSAVLAERLKSPDSVAFYKELYAYKPTEVTLPPAGQGGVTVPPLAPGLPPGHPPIGGSDLLSPLMLPPPPTTGSPAASTPKPSTDLPGDVFAPSPAPAAAPKAKEKEDGLPGDVFAPTPGAPKAKDATPKP